MTAALEWGVWSAARPGHTLPPGTHFTGGWAGGKTRPHRNSIPDCPTHSSVAIPTELPCPRRCTVPFIKSKVHSRIVQADYIHGRLAAPFTVCLSVRPSVCRIPVSHTCTQFAPHRKHLEPLCISTTNLGTETNVTQAVISLQLSNCGVWQIPAPYMYIYIYVYIYIYTHTHTHIFFFFFLFFDGATAPRGGPWPPSRYSSKPLDPLLCLSIRLFPFSQVCGHVIQPSHFWSSSSSCIQFLLR